MKKRNIIVIIVIILLIILFFYVTNQTKKVTVTFKSHNSNNEITIKQNGNVNPLKAPKRKGYKFVGWYLDGELFDFDRPIDKDVTLVAKWEKKDYQEYKVSFVVDEKIIHSEAVDEGATVSKPQDPIKDGYIFIGWYYKNRLFNFNEKIKENKKLVAKFEKSKTNTNENKKPSLGNGNSVGIGSGNSNSSNSGSNNNADVTPPKDFNFTADITTNSILVIAKTTDDVTIPSALKYYYSINNVSFQDSPEFSGLKANTIYTITVKVVDEAGNIRIVKQDIKTKSIATAEIENISTTKPTKNSVVITIKKSSEFTTYYSFDTKEWIETKNGKIEITENNKVYICYGDGQGNYGNIISYNVTNIDKIAPNKYKPTIDVTTNSITVSGTTTDNMTEAKNLIYLYKLDDGQFQKNGNFDDVQTGMHTILIKVVDEAGNELLIEEQVGVFKIERPIIKVDKKDTPTKEVTLTLENNNKNYTLQYKDSQDTDFKDCKLPLKINQNQKLIFRFTDGINYSEEVTINITNIDNSQPDVTFSSIDEEYHKEQTIKVTIKDNIKLASINYAISKSNSIDENTDWTTINEDFEREKQFDVLLKNKSGKYYILVKAKDVAGNITTTISPVILLDNELPTIELEKKSTSTNSVSIKVIGNDNISGIRGYYYSYDGGKNFSSLQTDGSYIFAGLKNNTKYSIVAKIEDNAGNQTTSKSMTVTTNDFGMVSMNAGEDKWATHKVVIVSYEKTPGETYLYKTDSKSQWENINDYPFEKRYDKNGVFYFKVSDGTNEQVSQFEINKIDPISPIVNELTTSDLDYNQVKLHVNAEDPGEAEERSEILGYKYSCGNGIYSNMTSEKSFFCDNLTKETAYEMSVIVYDNAGNATEEKINVTTLPKYEGNILPNTPEKLDGDIYFKADKNLDDYGFSLQKETWNNNEYTLDLNLSGLIGLKKKGTVDYTIQFKNNTHLPMTNGRIESTIVNNPLGYIKGVSASISKDEVKHGDSVLVTLSVNGNFLIGSGGQSVKAIATYTLQGKERQFIFNINYK